MCGDRVFVFLEELPWLGRCQEREDDCGGWPLPGPRGLPQMMVGYYEEENGCADGPRATMASILVIVNALFVSVLLVNLLIAMMGSLGHWARDHPIHSASTHRAWGQFCIFVHCESYTWMGGSKQTPQLGGNFKFVFVLVLPIFLQFFSVSVGKVLHGKNGHFEPFSTVTIFEFRNFSLSTKSPECMFLESFGAEI